MGASRPMLCPIVVGRAAEQAPLRAAVDRAMAGHGGVVALVGDAGSGKSRLAHETLDHARGLGLTVLTGRAAGGGAPVPYRPFTEAFLAASRGRGRPDDAALAGFEGHVGRLVPAWRPDTVGGADESPVLLGEAALRLLTALAGGPAVLLLEDLHWADVETRSVVDYLADALATEPVLCLVTLRPDGDAAHDMLALLRARRSAQRIDLEPLGDDDVRAAIAAVLDDPAPPPAVVDFVIGYGEGNPFLVEELLAGLVSSGSLVGDGGWELAAPLTPAVPTDVAHSIRARLASCAATTRSVLGAAAVLGRRFDWNLLPGVAEVDARAVVDGLREGVDAQIVEVDGHDFRFRHMLTREAVLADLLPPERRAYAQRAWPAVEKAHPGLPGAWCELAADLAEAAGDPRAATDRLVESARRALSAGALATAEATARRACSLAPDDEVGLDAQECLVQVLALAGKPADALAAGPTLTDRMRAGGADPDRLVGLLVVLARAAVAAGRLERADDYLDEAARLVDTADLAPRRAAVEAVAAHVALDGNDLDRADVLARAAVEHALDEASAPADPAVACEALEVIGRVARVRDVDRALEAFRRAADIAERHGLTGWLLRARQEIALDEWVGGDTGGLQAVRDLAARKGAMVTVAVMDLSLADSALMRFDRDGCLASAGACVDASRRYGLATLPVAELWLAGAYALAGDDEARAAAEARALARDPDDPRILGDLWGRVRATRSMVADDRDRLRADLDRMMEHVRRAPLGTSVFPGRLLWAVLSAVDDDDRGEAARQYLAGLSMGWWKQLQTVLEISLAVAHGRQGRADEAAAVLGAALERNEPYLHGNGSSHYLSLVVAEAQVRDGWGTPGALLRPAEAFFAERGYDAIARRCRVALGAAGEKMPRRGRGDAVVPEHLRAVGITSRELDVLELIVQGCSNREIGEKLHLSPKTVERHVGSLFDRTGIRNRTDLAAWVTGSS